MNKKAKISILLNIIIPLVLGGLIYYCYSPNVIFVQKIDALLGFAHHPFQLSVDAMPVKIIRNYLLDALWGYSLIFTIFLIIGNKTANENLVGLVGAVFAGLMELLQLTPLMNGTFDIMDIFVELVAIFIAVFIIKILRRDS